MKILLRRDSTNGHTKATLFMGPEGQTLANCGQLTMNAEEYAALRYALLMAHAQPLFPHTVEIQEKSE